MKLSNFITGWLWNHVAVRFTGRDPDFVITPDGVTAYMIRWYVIPRNRVFNVYLHLFLESDHETLHDHPWINASILLRGSYIEHRIAAGGVHYKTKREKGAVILRLPTTAHRVEVDKPAWTLFITGPRWREWGFHCPKAWKHHSEFTKRTAGRSMIGDGCA